MQCSEVHSHQFILSLRSKALMMVGSGGPGPHTLAGVLSPVVCAKGFNQAHRSSSHTEPDSLEAPPPSQTPLPSSLKPLTVSEGAIRDVEGTHSEGYEDQELKEPKPGVRVERDRSESDQAWPPELSSKEER